MLPRLCYGPSIHNSLSPCIVHIQISGLAQCTCCIQNSVNVAQVCCTELSGHKKARMSGSACNSNNRSSPEQGSQLQLATNTEAARETRTHAQFHFLSFWIESLQFVRSNGCKPHAYKSQIDHHIHRKAVNTGTGYVS